MKPICLIIMLFCGLLAGCSHDTREIPEDLHSGNRKILDILLNGDATAYHACMDSVKKAALAAGDSLMWSNYVTQEAVGAYYVIDAATLLAKSDSAINYLLRQPEGELRNIILHKAYLTKGAYYSQYVFLPDTAIYYHRLGVEQAARTSDSRALILALGNLADIYKLNSRLAEASDYYHRAITKADSVGCTPKEYISLYGGLAATYTALRDFNQSDIWWKKTMELYPYMIPYERFNNLNNYGNDFFYRKDYPGALQVFKRLDNYLDSVPQSEWEKNFVAMNLSDCYLHLNYPDSAKRLLDSASNYFTDVVPNPVAMSYLHSMQMRMHQLKGDFSRVEELIERYPLSDTIRPEQQQLRLEVLVDYYEQSGQLRKALDASHRLSALDDTLRSERVAQLAAARRIQYDSDTEMLRLRADKEGARVKMFRLWIWLVIAILVMCVLIGVMVILRIRSRRNEEKMHAGMIALRMESVRTRITPHFIYNALNHEILARQSGAPSRLKSIVALLRHQQYVAEEIVLPLSEELSFVEDYVAVERDTVQGDFTYEEVIAEGIDTTTIHIPSMSLQILVENVFKHGFRNMEPDAPKRLIIDVDHIGKDVSVTVFSNSMRRDSGSSPSSSQRGTGLKIIYRTLSFIQSKTGVALRFEMADGCHPRWGEGSWAVLTIPENIDLSTL